MLEIQNHPISTLIYWIHGSDWLLPSMSTKVVFLKFYDHSIQSTNNNVVTRNTTLRCYYSPTDYVTSEIRTGEKIF